MQHMHTGADLEIHHIIRGTSVPALRELVPVRVVSRSMSHPPHGKSPHAHGRTYSA